jgi:AcrR family transcriptional regulator
MVAPRRVRLQTDERRAQLLNLGIRLFSSRPYGDISIDDVAAAAGVSKGLLYHYFHSKREFYVETIRSASVELRRLTEPDPALPPHARLPAALDAHLNYIQQHGAVYTAIYRSGMTIAPEVSDILEQHRDVVITWIVRSYGLGKPRPVLRSALRAWIGMVEGASLDWIEHPQMKRDALRELLIAGYTATLAKALELDPKAARNFPPKARLNGKTNGEAPSERVERKKTPGAVASRS